MLPKLRLIILLAALWPGLTLSTGNPDDDWFEDDLEARVARVNEGDLAFLTEAPAEPVHHHHNRIVLQPSSLDDGWVTMVQCHSHLDAVPRAQILYHQHRVRQLSIISSREIENAWVEGHTVQLTDVAPGASLCIRADTRALEANEDGTYTLRSGPFMRRFLDGYYPMRVSMDIEVPREYLRFLDTQPQHQAGFEVRETPSGVQLDALFEGRLHTEVRFETNFCGDTAGASC